MEINPESLASPHIRAMAAYVPGIQPTAPGWVKLNTNELPVPPSPQVIEAIKAFLGEDGSKLRLYPNPTSEPLRQALAAHHQLDPAQVLIGNGADDILNLLMRTFCGPGRACGMTLPSYSLYAVLSQAQGAEMHEVPFDPSMTLPVEAIVSSEANLFLLTSPNAPTGVGFSPVQIAETAERFHGILAVDETYAPFADHDATGLLDQHPNLIIVRSFSKAYALAGLRVGYALASPHSIHLLDRVRDSYNVDALAQAGALAALHDRDYYAGVIAKSRQMRTEMAAWYQSLGWFVYPSVANFHFVEPVNGSGETGRAVATDLYEFLRERKILVRVFPRYPLTETFLRISLGSEAEMEALKKALLEWLA